MWGVYISQSRTENQICDNHKILNGISIPTKEREGKEDEWERKILLSQKYSVNLERNQLQDANNFVSWLCWGTVRGLLSTVQRNAPNGFVALEF